MEFLDSSGFRNLEAEKTVFQSVTWNFSRSAPSPLSNASVFTLVFPLMSKCVFSVRFTIFNFISSNAFVYSSFHEKIDFLFCDGLEGLPRDAMFGTNL